jgi:GT2 family glycosyltransferase/tetratricopeptide (TPR) repeat protein
MDLNKTIQSALEHYHAGDIKKAVEILVEILKRQPGNCDALELLGLICYQLKDYELAINCFEKTLQIDPNRVNAYFQLAIIYEDRGQLDKAALLREKAIQYHSYVHSTKPTFAAVYCVYDDVAWLSESLDSIYFSVDAIYFLISDRPWFGQPSDNSGTVELIESFSDKQGKISIIRGAWTNETEQRNAGLNILREKGFTYCFAIDADEIYDPTELKRMIDLVVSRPDVDCWHVSLDTYWKSYRYRIDPREPLKPLVFLKVGNTRFTLNRSAKGENHMVIVPELGICHHLSYAHSDAEVLKKISTFSHADEVIPGWFENIWKKWDSDHSLTNLHPTHPYCYQHAVEQPYSAFPPVLKRRYLAEARIGGDIIPGLTSIIILVHNQWIQTEGCLLSIKRHTLEPYEIILVDNGSSDQTNKRLRSLVQEDPSLKVIRNNSNRGFASGNNQGLTIARGEYIVLLNNDTIVTESWLGSMLNIFKQYPETGVIGPMSNCVSGPQLIPHIEHTTIEEIDSFAAQWRKDHERQSFPIKRVVGFCLISKRELTDRIGGLDEQFGSGNFEDDDFCIRARLAGYESRIDQSVFIHHKGGQTFIGSGIDYMKRLMNNWELFKAKWGIPPDTPYGTPYHLSMMKTSGISLYAPLPLLPADHQIDARGRWWEEK